MLANDIKKGMKLRLKNGFTATMMDNRKGNIRMCAVNGYCDDIGSVYIHDIDSVFNTTTNLWEKVEYSAAQITSSKKIKSFGW